MDLPPLVLAFEKQIIPMAFQVLNLFVCGDGQHTWLHLVNQVGSGLYHCDLTNSNVKQLLRNSSDSCNEIKRLCHYDDVIVFTDIVDRKVKTIEKVKIIIKVKNDHRSKFSKLSN